MVDHVREALPAQRVRRRRRNRTTDEDDVGTDTIATDVTAANPNVSVRRTCLDVEAEGLRPTRFDWTLGFYVLGLRLQTREHFYTAVSLAVFGIAIVIRVIADYRRHVQRPGTQQ